MNIIIFFLIFSLVDSMDLKYPISQYPSLNSLNCRSLTLTFSGSLKSLSEYLTPLMNDLKNRQLVQCYLIPDSVDLQQAKYDNVVLGGTFDYLHIGHQILLLTAIMKTRKKMMIGVTGEKMLTKKKNKQMLQPIQFRMKQVQNYIKRIKPQLQLQIQQINDPFGRSIIVPEYQAIVVSAETKIGGQKVNQMRKKNNLSELKIQICELLSENNQIQSKLSSSSIRQYIIKKNKMTLQQFSWYKQQWRDLYNRLIKYLKINKDELYIQTWWNRILTQYSQYWRFYHTNSHIRQLLIQFQKYPHKDKFSQQEILSIYLGIWFHDVQYVPSSKNNEQLSAQTAAQFIQGLCVNPKENQLIQRLIQMTKESIEATKHHKTQKQYIKLLLDLDMSVLDLPHEQYAIYAEMIKLEYQPIAKQHYNQKRTQFLKGLKPQEVFYFKKQMNIQKNIEWQIKHLNKQNKILNQL